MPIAIPSTMSIPKPATPLKPPGLTSDASPLGSYAKLSKKSSLADHLRVLEENLAAKFRAANDLQLAAMRAENDRVVAENDGLRAENLKLMERMDQLLKIIEDSPKLQLDDSELDDSTSVPAESPPPAVACDSFEAYDPFEATAEQRRILILSDSILRHVGVECPVEKPPRPDLLARQRRYSPKKPIIRDFMINNKSVSVHKVVIPGARCDRIIVEASLIAQKDADIYREVLVHVGANYDSPATAQREIEDCLVALQQLFPDASITFSEALPQYDEGYSDAVNNEFIEMNRRIGEFCLNRGMRTFGVDAFFIGRPRHLYARDGIHIGGRGIDAFNAALRDYFGYNLKYGICMGSQEFWMDGMFCLD